jgi:hypothetical protein
MRYCCVLWDDESTEDDHSELVLWIVHVGSIVVVQASAYLSSCGESPVVLFDFKMMSP